MLEIYVLVGVGREEAEPCIDIRGRGLGIRIGQGIRVRGLGIGIEAKGGQ